MINNTSYDFSSPYVTVTIVDGAGRDVALWQSTGQPTYKIKSLAYVTEVTVSYGMDLIPSLQVQMHLPYKEGIEFLESNLIEYLINHVRVEFGYLDGPNLILTGITQQPTVTIGESVNVTLNAKGAFSLLLGERKFNVENGTRSDIINRAIKGPDPKNPRSLTLNTKQVDKTSMKRLREKVDNYYSDLKSDWDVISVVAAQAYCTAYVSNNEVVLISRGRRFDQKVSKHFALMENKNGEIGPEVNIYPILSVSVNPSGVFLPGALRSIVVQSMTPQNKEETKRIVSDAIIAIARVGPVNAPATPAPSAEAPAAPSEHIGAEPQASSDGATHLFAPSDVTALASLITEEANRWSAQLGVQIDLSTIGVPDLLPGDLVEVSGVSSRYNCLYSIRTLTHSFGASGFTTKFTAFSNLVAVGESIRDAQDKGGIPPTNKPLDSLTKDNTTNINTLIKEPEIYGIP